MSSQNHSELIYFGHLPLAVHHARHVVTTAQNECAFALFDRFSSFKMF